MEDKVGLTQHEIQFFDVRTRTLHFYVTVGDLYDLLVACELPVIADLLKKTN